MSGSDEELERSSESCERWGWGCGGIVVVGLIAEAILAGWEPSHETRIGRWGPLFSDVLVALGVAGEIMFSRMGWRRERELTRRANQRDEESQLEIARLGAKVAPRRLDAEVLIKAITGLPKPPSPVRVVHLKNDNEAESLAWQIAFTLGAGNGPDWPMQVVHTDDLTASGAIADGLTVTEHAPNLEVSVLGRALVNGLTAAVGRVGFSVDGRGPPGTIRIIVAQKPL